MRRAIRRNDVARDHREQDIIEKKDTIGETKWYGHSKKDIKNRIRWDEKDITSETRLEGHDKNDTLSRTP
jgi:hypothetical protein